MQTAKWSAIILGAVVLLLAAAVLILTTFVDPNRYRSKVVAIVADLAGRPFVIDGPLSITWYPWLGIRTGPAHLDNVPGAAGPPLVEWQSVAVAAKVWPLLHGQIVADRIQLGSPHIHLRRDAQGHGNWEGLGPRKTAPSGAPSQPLQIAGIEIRDGLIDYADAASGRQASLSNVDLDLGEWLAGQSLPIHTRFLARAESLPPEGVWIQIDSPAAAVRTEPFAVTAPKLSVQIANARMDGDIAYSQADGHIRAHGALALQTPSVRKLAQSLALNKTLPRDPTTLGPLELTTNWSYDDGSMAAKPLALKLDGVTFSGWLERSAEPRAMWGFELHGDRIDLGRYINVDSTNKKPFELPTAALRAINANGSVIFDQVVLADTRMTDVHLKVQTPKANHEPAP